jgi:uncharacterized protein (TIGR02265 family)
MSNETDSFVAPNFALPIDPAAQKRLVPAGATVKGMQLQGLLDEQSRSGHSPTGRYVAFRDYPGEELIDRLVETAARCHPSLAPREGLRRVGHSAYGTLSRSTIGKVLFAVAGSVPRQFLTVAAQAYSVSGSTGAAEVLSAHDGEAVVRLTEIYSFVDSWHVGIFEGAFRAMGAPCVVRVRLRGPTSADLLLRW